MAYCVTGATPAMKYHSKRSKLRRGLHYLLWWWNVMKRDNRFLKTILRARTKRKEKEVSYVMNAKRPKDVGILQHHARLPAPLGVFPISPLLFRRPNLHLISFCFVCFFFVVHFFFSLPLYAPSMNTNSSYASFILSYTELHLCFSFWFLVFLKSPRYCPFSHFVFLSLILQLFFFITSRVHSLFYDLPRSIRSLIPRFVV